MNWNEQIYAWGERGDWDYSEANPRVVKPSSGMLEPAPTWGLKRLRTLPPRHDVAGYDHPREDVRSYPLRSSHPVRAGSDDPSHLDRFGRIAVPLIDGALSPDEQRRMNIYYEYPDRSLRNNRIGGLTDFWVSPKGIPYSTIAINRTSVDSGHILLHETIHVARQSHTTGNDLDVEEAKTELETIARLPYREFVEMQKTLGYYLFLREDPWAAAKHDRVLLTGSLQKHLIGPAARARVDAVFPRTRLSKLRINNRLGPLRGAKGRRMRPEDVDRHFEVVLADGRRVGVHLSLTDRMSDDDIRALLRKRYRNVLTLYEFHDGCRSPL